MCIFEQMLVSELAVMVQGYRQLQNAGRARVMAKIPKLAQLR
jgi:hypothetical protein